MNYKGLWEGLREFDGHRKLTPYTKYPRLEYKTIDECMDNIEELQAKGILKGAVKHHKDWGGEDNG